MKKQFWKQMTILTTMVTSALVGAPMLNLAKLQTNQLEHGVKKELELDSNFYNITVNYKYNGPMSCYTPGTNVGSSVSGLSGSESVNRTISSLLHYGDLEILARHVLAEAFDYPELSGLTNLKYANNRLTFKAPVEFKYNCRMRKPMYPDNGEHTTSANSPHLKPTNAPPTSDKTTNSFYWNETQSVILNKTDVELIFTHDIWDFGVDMNKFPSIRENLIQINKTQTYRGFKSVVLATEINNEFLKSFLLLAQAKISAQKLLDDEDNVKFVETEAFKKIVQKLSDGSIIDTKDEFTRYFVNDMYLSREQYDLNYWMDKLRKGESLTGLDEVATEYPNFANKYEISFDNRNIALNFINIFMSDKVGTTFYWSGSSSTEETVTKLIINFDKISKTFRFGDGDSLPYCSLKINDTNDNIKLNKIEFSYPTGSKEVEFEMPLNLLLSEATHNFNEENYYYCNPKFEIRNLFRFNTNWTRESWISFLNYNNFDNEISINDFLENPSMWVNNEKILKRLFAFKGSTNFVTVYDDNLKNWLLEVSDSLYLNTNFEKFVGRFSVSAADLSNKITIDLAYRDIDESGNIASNKLIETSFSLFLTPDYQPVMTDTAVTNQELHIPAIPETTDIKKYILDNFIAHQQPKDNALIYTSYSAADWEKEILEEIVILENSKNMIQGIIKYKKWINFNDSENIGPSPLEEVNFSLTLNAGVTDGKDETNNAKSENQLQSYWLEIVIVLCGITIIIGLWLIYIKYKKRLMGKNVYQVDEPQDKSTIELF